MVVLGYELKMISFSINSRPRQMPEYTKVGLKIAHHLTKGREPLPICRDCFDSGMNLAFSAKATNFKTKGQEDNKLNIEKKRKTLKAAGKSKCRKF
eukprot:scaffold67813_cov58-Attheya_sp.AAC.2